MVITASSGQEITQTIKGTIIDLDSKSPIIGANVIILGSDPIKGSSTNLDGEFRIEKVALGRMSLVISSIGYEQRVIPNIVVGAGKEVVINTSMVESIYSLDEIVVRPKQNKSEVSNEMVQVSSRAFSVEETKRYAGTFNDPARMVTGFAGITGNAEGTNHIVVRGNSPNNVKWRMEGIEIPNPNHFAEEGSSGGAINALNSAMLTDSDFYTGAFTSDYGNVMAGVFDMKMRSGNREEREYSLGIGILGTDITLEGPFSMKGNSSYLANYRYSTLALLDDAGIIDYGGVPKYQDLAFKLSFPTENAGLFTVFGLGGKSKMLDNMTDDETEDILAKNDFSASLGTANLGHVYFLDENNSIESYLSVSQNGSSNEYMEPTLIEDEFETTFNNDLDKYTVRMGTMFNSKINSRNTLRTGLSYNHYIYTFRQKLVNNNGDLETILDDEGDAGMVSGFATWKHRWSESWTFTGGLHYMNFLLNDSQVLEPRASVKYNFNGSQSIFAGVGVHSQMPSLPAYYTVVEDGFGNSQTPNLDMDFMKAIHYVLGYDRMLNENLYFKTEVYYQDLYDIPVENDRTSSYSLINAVQGITDRALVNQGGGVNYGVEVTLEKYFSNNFYYLLTGSLFDSKYTAMDNKQRDTMFNSNYITNVLFGKEFVLGSRGNKTLNFSTRFSWAGARRITPIDLEASQERGWPVYDEANAFTERGDDIIKWDVSIAYSWNKPKLRQEFKLDIQNMTNNQGIVDEYYNSATNEIEYSTQLPMFPVLMYTIEF
jgi:hypothetical protein